MNVCIVPTGTANLASVLGALSRVGARASLARSAVDLADADALVLPGVGSFAAGRRGLDDAGLSDPVSRWVSDGRPALAICLGLQLLAQGSDEAPGVGGLAVLPARATLLPDTVRVPQLGWNLVTGGELVRDGYAYFANSYRLTDKPPGWRVVWADHGGPLVAALERGPQLLCQFHPELSGGWGHELLSRWLTTARQATGKAAAC